MTQRTAEIARRITTGAAQWRLLDIRGVNMKFSAARPRNSGRPG